MLFVRMQKGGCPGQALQGVGYVPELTFPKLADPAEAAATRKTISDLKTRKIMKLAGTMNYKLGEANRVAFGYVPDVAFGQFRKDK